MAIYKNHFSVHFPFPRLLFSLLLVVVALCTAPSSAYGQKNNPVIEQQARAAIKARGLDEDEVRARLLERGIDIDKIKPEQVSALQPTIEAVLTEMENEKKARLDSLSRDGSFRNRRDKNGRLINSNGRLADSTDLFLQDTFFDEERPPNRRRSGRDSLLNDTTIAINPNEIYGHQLFRQKNLRILKNADVRPPDNYVLSSGDELTISIFGSSQFDSKFTISPDGYIKPTGIPIIFLKGLRLSQARQLVRARYASFYRFAPEQFALTLTAARSITVSIFGETVNAGSFTVSAVNTAFNALVAAGGPTELGTVRNIRVIRGGQSTRLDLYELINNPAVQYNYFLEDNDVINVPVAQRVVAVQGAIQRPYRYELIEGEQWNKLLTYAGGFSANAYQENVQVRRFINGRQVLIDVNLKDLSAGQGDFTLLNGDSINVRSIASNIQNVVSVEGAVEYPGQYSLTETRRVSDLLRQSVLRREARTDVAFLSRTNPDKTTRLLQVDLAAVSTAPGSAGDLLLQPQDLLTVYTSERFTDRSTVNVVGAVRDSLIEYPYSEDSTLTLQRAILLAGGLSPDASGQALLLRTNPNNIKERAYLEVDLVAAFDQPNSPANVLLQPLDRLEVLSRPAFADAATIRVDGAVRKTGEFPYGSNMSLRDALLLAGGLRLEAARNRVDIFRVQIRDNEPTKTVVATLQVDSNFTVIGAQPNGYRIQPFDEIVVRSVPEFEFQRYVQLQGEVRYPGRYALLSNNERVADIIERAGGLSPEAFEEGGSLYRQDGGKGFVVTNFKEALRDQKSPHNHILKEGDVLNVPKREDLVSIRTAYTQAAEILKASIIANGLINVAYYPRKRAGWYVRHYAAGFAERARRGRVSVENPNGKIGRTVNFGPFHFYPKVLKGSIISVAGKPVKEPKLIDPNKKKFDWDKALTQILATLGTLATVVVATAALNRD